MRHQSWALVCAIAGVPNVAVRTTAAAPSAMMDFVNIVVSWLLHAPCLVRAAILFSGQGRVNPAEVPAHVRCRGARAGGKSPPVAAFARLGRPPTRTLPSLGWSDRRDGDGRGTHLT